MAGLNDARVKPTGQKARQSTNRERSLCPKLSADALEAMFGVSELPTAPTWAMKTGSAALRIAYISSALNAGVKHTDGRPADLTDPIVREAPPLRPPARAQIKTMRRLPRSNRRLDSR